LGNILAQTLMQSTIQTSQSRPTSATGTNSGPTDSDQSSNQSPLLSQMFKSKKTSSTIDLRGDSDASLIVSPPSPSTSSTALQWSKLYTMTGRDGEYFGNDEVTKFDRLDIKIPVELIDPQSDYACHLPAVYPKQADHGGKMQSSRKSKQYKKSPSSNPKRLCHTKSQVHAKSQVHDQQLIY